MYGFKILCEISKVSLEISHKIMYTHRAKYAFPHELSQVMIS